jgi:hypothetical protein
MPIFGRLGLQFERAGSLTSTQSNAGDGTWLGHSGVSTTMSHVLTAGEGWSPLCRHQGFMEDQMRSRVGRLEKVKHLGDNATADDDTYKTQRGQCVCHQLLKTQETCGQPEQINLLSRK